MTYLIWQDLDPRRPLTDKIAQARAAWEARTSTPANVVLLPADADTAALRPAGYALHEPGALVVGRGCVYVGRQ